MEEKYLMNYYTRTPMAAGNESCQLQKRPTELMHTYSNFLIEISWVLFWATACLLLIFAETQKLMPSWKAESEKNKCAFLRIGNNNTFVGLSAWLDLTLFAVDCRSHVMILVSRIDTWVPESRRESNSFGWKPMHLPPAARMLQRQKDFAAIRNSPKLIARF